MMLTSAFVFFVSCLDAVGVRPPLKWFMVDVFALGDNTMQKWARILDVQRTLLSLPAVQSD
jgi:hypothetical protein